MSGEAETDSVVREVPIDQEERRANRDLRHWLVKTLTLTFMVILVASTASLIYAAVIQEKDLDTGFIGELFKGLFDFLRLIS